MGAGQRRRRRPARRSRSAGRSTPRAGRRPTRSAALAGSMVPAAEHKGSALALLVDVMSGGVAGSNFSFEASGFGGQRRRPARRRPGRAGDRSDGDDGRRLRRPHRDRAAGPVGASRARACRATAGWQHRRAAADAGVEVPDDLMAVLDAYADARLARPSQRAMNPDLGTSWRRRPGYLDTATYGLPPAADRRSCPTASSTSGTKGRRCGTSWNDAADDARHAVRVLGRGGRRHSVAVGPSASGFAGLVAASLPDSAEVVVPAGEFTSLLFPLLVQADRGVVVREVPLEALADSVTATDDGRGLERRAVVRRSPRRHRRRDRSGASASAR